jgi:hypothetical protein
VNDAFVMGAWARDQKTGGKVRMLADGSAAFAQATGLTLDLTAKGLKRPGNMDRLVCHDPDDTIIIRDRFDRFDNIILRRFFRNG